MVDLGHLIQTPAMAVEFRCEFPGCTVVKSADSEETALGLLQLHQTNVHSNATQKQRPPKVDRPQIAGGATAEEWATFNRRWETFKSATDMSQAETKCQLLACREQELEANLFKDDPKLRDKTEGDILAAMKSLAVIDVAATVRVTELLAMKQDHGEGIRAFVARVRGTANICAMEKACTCGLNVNYTDEVVRWVILAGLSSPEIAREVLGTMDIDRKSLSDTVSIVESKERAARACMGESAYKSIDIQEGEEGSDNKLQRLWEDHPEVRSEQAKENCGVHTVHRMLSCQAIRTGRKQGSERTVRQQDCCSFPVWGI